MQSQSLLENILYQPSRPVQLELKEESPFQKLLQLSSSLLPSRKIYLLLGIAQKKKVRNDPSVQRLIVDFINDRHKLITLNPKNGELWLQEIHDLLYFNLIKIGLRDSQVRSFRLMNIRMQAKIFEARGQIISAYQCLQFILECFEANQTAYQFREHKQSVMLQKSNLLLKMNYPVKAINILNNIITSLDKSTKIQHRKIVSVSFFRLGLIFSQLGHAVNSQLHLRSSLALAKQIKFEDLQERIENQLLSK